MHNTRGGQSARVWSSASSHTLRISLAPLRVGLDQRPAPIPSICLRRRHAVPEEMRVHIGENASRRPGAERADVLVQAVENVERQRAGVIVHAGNASACRSDGS